MKPRMLIVGVLALVCGLSAVILVNTLRKPGGPTVERAGVVFATAEVQAGETLAETMLEVRQIPVDQIPEDAIRKLADAVDRAVLGQVDKGDLLRQKKLAERGAGRGMAALIRTGMRAFTIQTPSFSSSVAGFLLPGNKVDVLLTATTAGGQADEFGGSATTTLLQNVEILAVHTTVNAPTTNKINPEDARSITLLVTPHQASLLDLGQNKGTLHLSLRNLKDSGESTEKPATLADIPIFAPKPKPEPIAAVPAPAVASKEIDEMLTPPAPPPPPEMRIRTLRGTVAGIDRMIYVDASPTLAVAPRAAAAASGVVSWPPANGPGPMANSGNFVAEKFER